MNNRGGGHSNVGGSYPSIGSIPRGIIHLGGDLHDVFVIPNWTPSTNAPQASSLPPLAALEMGTCASGTGEAARFCPGSPSMHLAASPSASPRTVRASSLRGRSTSRRASHVEPPTHIADRRVLGGQIVHHLLPLQLKHFQMIYNINRSVLRVKGTGGSLKPTPKGVSFLYLYTHFFIYILMGCLRSDYLCTAQCQRSSLSPAAPPHPGVDRLTIRTRPRREGIRHRHLDAQACLP